ncbi:uncharacterized protein DS421_19g658490 [Arachis hypogaea]|uniref:Aminotransferase-like plant mobile domain-containing protein n=1 Tax=Arachis hypogaea TaxID=3818 RepID=A0A6B9V9P9_ARAHY|nr:uncharacterized protein DS421_19g658490 [Arachis hypogaea]
MLFLVTLKENLLLFKTPFLVDTLTPTTGYSEIPQRPTLKVTMLGLMGGALYFWDETSHTFHTSYGMITPTLLDVAAITGLPPLGKEILTTTRSTTGVEYAIDISFTTYQSFILNNKGQRGEPVSDNEHIAFLLYWLSGVVFCARSIQVEVTYLPLVIMLAEGKRLCLGPGLTISHSRLDHSPYEGEEKNH